MPGGLEVAFEEDRPVAEGRHRLALGRLARALELGFVADDPHPASAAARCGLDEERVVELAGIARLEHGHPCSSGDPLGLELVAARTESRGRRADPDEPRRLDRLGELGAL